LGLICFSEVSSVRTRWCCSCWLALIALCEESERVHLPNEVGHASPSAEPKTNHQHPHHHEGVDNIHGGPAWHEKRRLLCSILPEKQYSNKLSANKLRLLTTFFDKICICDRHVVELFEREGVKPAQISGLSTTHRLQHITK